MIFYIATDPDGKKHVLTVEAEAKKIDKAYTTIEQPNDKAALKKLIQESFDHIHQLEGQIRLLKSDAQIAPVTIPYDPEQDLLDPEKMSESTEAMLTPRPASAHSSPAATEPADTRLPTPDRPASYIGWTIETEANFARLPLAHQLSLAQGAIERARESAVLCYAADKQITT
jgi:hypothetical protein